jgi:predicted GIY-YIG superfamily endonuclease
MSDAATGEESYVYAVSCRRLGLLKIGVADDPGKRLRELQVVRRPS